MFSTVEWITVTSMHWHYSKSVAFTETTWAKPKYYKGKNMIQKVYILMIHSSRHSGKGKTIGT